MDTRATALELLASVGYTEATQNVTNASLFFSVLYNSSVTAAVTGVELAVSVDYPVTINNVSSINLVPSIDYAYSLRIATSLALSVSAKYTDAVNAVSGVYLMIETSKTSSMTQMLLTMN